MNADADSQSDHAPRTTGAIAEAIGASLIGPADLPIRRISAIDDAGPGSITFIRSGRFAHRWAGSKASAAISPRNLEIEGHDASTRALLLVDDADVAMTRLLRLLAPPRPSYPPGVHETALVDDTAELGQGVHVGPYCVIGPETVIGDGTVLVGRVWIGRQVQIGPICTMHPGVVILDRCEIGSACEFFPNVTIGADGFGYHPAPDGKGLWKIPHIGTVRIGDGVDIGANSCVDRAKFGVTTIGDGTKIDNLVQVAHNVKIGRCVIICGCSGIAGSVTIGDGAVIGAAVGVSDGFTVGAGAKIGARSAVMNDVPPGETWFGYPATQARDYMRSLVAVKQLSDHLRALRKLEKTLDKGEQP